MEALGAKWKSQLYDFPPTLPCPCPNLFDLSLDWNGVHSWMGLEQNKIQSWVVKVDSTQIHEHLFDKPGASPIHFQLNILFWGPNKIPFVFPPPLFERISFGMESIIGAVQPN